MNCEYYFKDSPSIRMGYEELIKFITAKDKFPNKISDILFSASENRRVNNIEKIKKIKLDLYKELDPGYDKHSRLDSMLGGYDLEYTTPGTLTIQQALSSTKFQIDGNRLYTPMDLELLKKHIIERYILDLKLTEEEAYQKLESELSNYKIVEEDARLIKKLVVYSPLDGNSILSFYDYFLTNSTDDLKNKRISRNVIIDFYNQLSSKFWKGMVIDKFDPKLLEQCVNKAFNIESDLTFDGDDKQKLTGHIDYLIVDNNGYLHLYNFVTGSKLEWGYDKRLFYELKLLVLKRMLQNNGVDIEGITLHNIPIYLKYSEDNIVESISVGSDKQIYVDERRSDLLNKDYQIGKFIKSKLNFNLETTDKITDKLRSIFTSIFPSDLNLDPSGLHKQVTLWIKEAPETNVNSNPLVIKYIGQQGKYYEIYINGKKVADITSNAKREKNQEIIDIVTKYSSELNDNRQNIVLDMYRAIYNSHRLGYIQEEKYSYLCEHLSEYIYDKTEDEKGQYHPNWEILTDLLLYNIILLKKDDNVDVIYLGTSNLDLEIDFKNGLHNLLGKIANDIDSVPLRGTIGNLYSIISLLTLNEFLPNLNLEEFKLGKIITISCQGLHVVQQYNAQHLIKKYFTPIIKKINKIDGLDIKNNYIEAKFSDLLKNIVFLLNTILSSSNLLLKLEVREQMTDAKWEEKLLNILNDKLKELQLKRLLDFISTTFFDNRSYQSIIEIIKGNPNRALYPIANLYKIVSDAYLLYSNQSLEYDKIIDTVEENVIKPAYISSRNPRLIVNNYRSMLDAMSDDINANYNDFLRKPIMEYYKEIGYTALRNSTIGMQESVYKNMFEKDPVTGKLKMIFKNPYINLNDKAYLTDPERKFLKRAIFLFNKMLHPEFIFKDENDLNFINKVNSPDGKQFLWVPLQRASSDTLFLKKYANKIERLFEYLKNKKILADDLLNKMDDIVRGVKFADNDMANLFGNLHVGNKFLLNEQARNLYIRDKGVDYFETNVEDLLIDVLGEVVEVDKTNRFLITTKAIMFLLELMKLDYEGSVSEVIDKELNYIKDYLKVNVMKTYLAKGVWEEILKWVMPIRKFVVDVNLIGNIGGFFRDLDNGFVENFFRSVSKYQTDITKSDLAKAYTKFFSEAVFNNAMKVNLLNQLCCIYRISNVDLARITERLKTGRAGLSNYENWLYSTLRAPDFLHRMALFMAKCIHDGVIDPDNENNSAFYIKDDRLVYDWKRDKRWLHLANGDKSDPEYEIEFAKYTGLIDLYNAEHPGKEELLYYKDDNVTLEDLPSPYSEGEIQHIKEAASNVYGDYDRSNKALGEFKALGLIFAMYTTWMNGIITNMTMKPGLYSPNERIWTQMEDAGGKLFRDPKNFNKFVHESDLKEDDRRIPVYYQELGMAQGLLPTLESIYYYCREGGIHAAMDYIKGNEYVKSLMKNELIDLLMTLLWIILYKIIFDPKYKEYKKQAEGERILTNFMTEIIYKSTRASFDTFKGPWNIIQYLGDNMNPPVWLVPVGLITDMSKFAFGEKTFYQILTGNFGFARSFRDTYNLYKRDVIQ